MFLSIRRSAPPHPLITPQRARPRYEVCGAPVPVVQTQKGYLQGFLTPIPAQWKVVLCPGSWFILNLSETFLSILSREVEVKMRMTQMKGMTIPSVRAVHLSNRTSYKKSQRCPRKSHALPLPPKVRYLHRCLQTDNGEKESFALFHFLMMRINLLHQRYHFFLSLELPSKK